MANSGNSSDSSSSSSSLSSDDRKRRRRRHRHDDQHNNKSDRKRKHHNDDHGALATPSDWDELRAHYQFVLPDDQANNVANQQQQQQRQYGSSWQERMVQHYHTHLYKEYVLADLSRVKDHNGGKIGLRWRTEKEVANGRGFNCCGNLMCRQQQQQEKKKGWEDNGDDNNDNAAAIKRYMGIGVPENGGKEPLGIILPRQATASATLTTVDNNKNDDQNESSNDSNQQASPLERYLQSCAKERRKMEQNKRRQHGDDKKSSSKKQKKQRKRHKRTKPYYSLEEQEYKEQHRLSQLPHGIGLHDYEVDFIYAEQGLRKRELVKVRLCLQCAPLLFLSKLLKGGSSGGDNGSHGKHKDDSTMTPAVKAREAREKAARSHYEEIVVYARGAASSTASAANENVESSAITNGVAQNSHDIK